MMKFSLITFISFMMPACFGQSLHRAPTRVGAGSAEAVAVMHCLTDVELNWLGDSPPVVERTRNFHVGLRHDRRTYPGEDIVFVVVFEDSTKGDFFELKHEGRAGQQNYNLENNGSFNFRRNEFACPNEIFGGIWTHEYIERNVRRIMRGPKTSVPIRTALKPMTHLTCSYYGSD